MGIYAVNLAGRTKRVLVSAKNQTAAVDLFVSAKALNASETADAFTEGEAIWKPGTDLPPDEAAEEKSADAAEAQAEAE